MSFRRFFQILIFLLAFNLFSEESEEKRFLKEFSSDVKSACLLEITGKSFSEKDLSLLSECLVQIKTAALFTIRDDDFVPHYVFDWIFPEYKGQLNALQLYDSSTDDGSWVIFDSEITESDFTVQEPEDIFEENSPGNRLENGPGNRPEKSEEPGKAGEKRSERKDGKPGKRGKNAESEGEKRALDSEGFLKSYSFDSEIFSTGKRDGKNVIVRTYNDRLQRSFYDEKLRLVKREKWTLSAETDNSKITETDFWTYGEEDEVHPLEGKILSDDKMTLLDYDENGRIVKARNYISGGENNEKWILSSRTSYSYNAEGKLSVKDYAEYSYENTESWRLTEKLTRKDVYEYKVNSETPDWYYYENGEIHLSEVHSSPEDYISTAYFKDGFTVEAHYTAGKRIKDVFYLNGVQKRVRNYVAD